MLGVRGRRSISPGNTAVEASGLAGIRKKLTDSGNGRVRLDAGQSGDGS